MRRTAAGIAIGVAGLLPAAAAGQGLFIGLQGSVAENADFGLGPRAILDLGPFDAGLRLVGSFEVFFPDAVDFETGGVAVEADNVDYWEANLNLVYTLGLPVVPITPYVGAGLNVAHVLVEGSPEESFNLEQTDQGVNLLAGVELEIAGLAPFFEFRYEIEGGEQWIATGGLTFR